MSKNKVVLLLLACLISMTACTDVQVGNNDISAMKETNAKEAEASANNSNSENPEESDDTQDAENEPEQEAEAEDEKNSSKLSTPAKLSDNLYDFQISIDGTIYQLPMKYADFESLGWHYDGDNHDTLSVNQYVARQQWRKDGVFIHTKLANFSTDTIPFSDSMVSGIHIDRYMVQDCDWKILLPSGIQWGVSNADDIKEAYGDPVSDYDGVSYYKMIYQDGFYREIDLYVYKDTNVLEQIDIENLPESKDIDAQPEVQNNENPEL